MRITKCPYGSYEDSQTGIWKEKCIDTDKCSTENCGSCGWNPKVEESRKKMIRAGDWSFKAAFSVNDKGEKVPKIVRFIKSGRKVKANEG